MDMRRTIIAAVAFITLSGCYTERKANRQVLKAQAHYPDIVAADCGDWYPPKESTVTKTEYRPGVPVYFRDTVRVDCDSVVRTGKQPLVTVPCPPRSIRVDTFYSVTFRTLENTAKITALQAQYGKEHDRAGQLLHERNLWRIVALSALGAIIAFVVIKWIL